MEIITLQRNYGNCRCNSYLILGSPNKPTAINTIIDPGSDASILDEIQQQLRANGKNSLSQVIITHSYVDHAGGADALKKSYNSRTLALQDGPGVDELLQDGQFINAADDILEVLHTPGDAPDSICLYAPSEKALFSGDIELRQSMWKEIYSRNYMDSLLKIACREILSIYSSHGEPVMRGSQSLILHLLDSIRQNNFSPLQLH